MDITFKLKIKAGREVIYKAVASQTGINGWWSKDCIVGEQKGEASHLKFDKQGTIVEMGFKTLELKDNEKVVWECVENGNPSWLGTKIVTEIIADDGDFSQVVFSHAEFDEKWKGNDAFEMTKGGWEHFTQSLISYCEKGEGQPW